MRNRSKVALSALVMVGTLPLIASSCQQFTDARHFDITTMTVGGATVVEGPPDTFRFPAGPAKRVVRIALESRVTLPGGASVPTQPEFCTLDLGGRMDISFTFVGGGTFVGEVLTPTAFGAGKSAAGSLSCQLAGSGVIDRFTIVVVK